MDIQITIKSRLGCGIKLIGFRSLTSSDYFIKKKEFRREPCEKNERYTSVEYLFFTLFWLPIWPLGCYRISNKLNKEYFDNPGEDYIQKEKPILKEVLWIYFDRWVISLFLVFLVVVYFLYLSRTD